MADTRYVDLSYYAPDDYAIAGVYIDWADRVIYIPKDFLNWLGGQNYALDTNAFRMALKDAEDSEWGMCFPDTHRHNTTVLLGGIEYARIIEMINGYTVTFEDGNYTVSLIGSNNNILDVTNLNNVAVRSNNSAGLIQTQEIEHSSFNGGVTVDVANGSAGTLYPIGTTRRPVNNIADARIIASLRGFSTIYVVGDLTLSTGDDVSDMLLVGNNASRTFIDIQSASETASVEIRNATITGILDGGTILRECYVFDLSYVNGFIFQSELAGTITLGGGMPAHIMNCYAEVNYTTIDMGGSGNALNMQQCSGDFRLINKTGSDNCGVHITSGTITLEPSVTNADGVHVAGVGGLINNTGLTLTRNNMVSVSAIFEQAQITPIKAESVVDTATITEDILTDSRTLTVSKFIALGD
jgi:hypothetical protein